MASLESERAAASERQLDLVAALLLSLAAVGSAWGAYQANRWGGVQSSEFDRAAHLRAESVRSSNQAFSETQIDVSAFIAWAVAYSQGQAGVADFVRVRFRQAFVPFFDRWYATTVSGAAPDGTPFQDPAYRAQSHGRADELAAAADAASASAQRANGTSDQYVLTVVIFTFAALFSGLSGKMHSPRMRLAFLAVSAVVWVAAAGFMLGLRLV